MFSVTLNSDPIWVLVPMAVASIVSVLLAAKPRVLPAMSKPVISKLPRANLRAFGAAFLFCNIFVPPLNCIEMTCIENSLVYRWANRKELPRPREPLGYGRRGRTASTKSTLWPVLRGLRIQGRDQWLGRWGHGDRSRQNNVPRGNVPAVHATVIAIVWTDC